jgi:hypothetical protein
MTEVQLLRYLADNSDPELAFVQINISDALPVDSSFAGNQGWLRYQSKLTCSDALQPITDQGALMAGEWVDSDLKTTRISLDDGAVVMHLTQEKPLVEGAEPDAGWTPVLKQSATVMARDFDIGGNTLRYAIYFGFRDDGDASEGLIRRLTDRFTGVSDTRVSIRKGQ